MRLDVRPPSVTFETRHCGGRGRLAYLATDRFRPLPAQPDPERRFGSLTVRPDQRLRSGVLIAFAVDDILGAREELAAAKVELVGDIVWARDITGGAPSDRWGWYFIRAPDGNIYVIQQDGIPDSE